MEKYREARKQIMEVARAYRKYGISCKSIYDEMSAKLSAVRMVASYDTDISIGDFKIIAEEIGNCIEILMTEYRKEMGLEDEQ